MCLRVRRRRSRDLQVQTLKYALTDRNNAADYPVLTAADHAHFEAQGYVIVKDAVPPENIEAAKQAIYDFLGVSPDDPESWYREPVQPGGNVEMHQHPASGTTGSTHACTGRSPRRWATKSCGSVSTG